LFLLHARSGFESKLLEEWIESTRPAEPATSGEIVRPTVWGEGKLTAVRTFGKDHHFDLADSYFYTDAAEDLPLLEAVGKPRVVNPDNRLAMIAGEKMKNNSNLKVGLLSGRS
jgi:phosphoserine phosphatase